jgi:phosphoribosylformylglycinamidine synthase PurS subunit
VVCVAREGRRGHRPGQEPGAAEHQPPSHGSRLTDAADRRQCCSPYAEGVARVVVDVMPKPEILDPQGQAVAGALVRLGVAGVADVRQGKHFELEVDDAIDDETLHRVAGTLLANPVIEDWVVTRK